MILSEGAESSLKTATKGTFQEILKKTVVMSIVRLPKRAIIYKTKAKHGCECSQSTLQNRNGEKLVIILISKTTIKRITFLQECEYCQNKTGFTHVNLNKNGGPDIQKL